ncbi:diaminopimelate decarboxylase [Candidatus Epulonipiscium fishelsonii]|uniref:Diaminopimelate decarboxylase n=1 Tax=Candidatus Epulonipiscium fishelsonii TaxID=77094 RepID=A0ACC8XAU1_9FIRM|nr:diaminopimelate decarboxylase [Epulopiscium sp. SCG-D08WGA-EpuloA1]
MLELIKEFGSPLYVYKEDILRQKCIEIKNLVTYKNFVPHFSVKANTNIHLLRIIREEGLHADTMSPGEIFMALQAGFTSKEIFYVPNNATKEDLKYAIDRNILTSLDSLNQLKLYCLLNPNSEVAVRFNPGVGAGHHEKVVTAGKNTKFGINLTDIEMVKVILKQYNMTLVGINQHIGSLFMDADAFIQSTKYLLKIALQFDNLKFIDLGGGFGIPYHKQNDETPLDIKKLGKKLDKMFTEFTGLYKKDIQFRIEPGRYVVCECGNLIGQITDVKENANTMYLGTDIGFNVLARPVMYNAYHDIDILSKNEDTKNTKVMTVVGNICESGDILAKDRCLPFYKNIIEDLIVVKDVGAYGYSMSSSYNTRPKCAEVLITNDKAKLIRKRETFEDILATMDV